MIVRATVPWNDQPRGRDPYITLLVAIIKQAHRDAHRPWPQETGRFHTQMIQQDAEQFLEWCREQLCYG